MLEVLDFNPEPEVFALEEVVNAVAGRLRTDAASAGVELEVEVEAPGVRVELRGMSSSCRLTS